MSIKPKYVSMILNNIKTIEVRKRFPSDYVGWVYIYCTKEDNLMKLSNFHDDKFVSGKEYDITNFVYLNSGYDGKGKVVARFWCDKVDTCEIQMKLYDTNSLYVNGKYGGELHDNIKCEIRDKACLTSLELLNYAYDDLDYKTLYAIHITKLEIFDEPKEIGDFEHQVVYKNIYTNEKRYLREPLRKAPQSWCYVEI